MPSGACRQLPESHRTSVFEPLKAIDSLAVHRVNYVVVGGWGALQHGASRLTQDLDICPELTPENLDRLGRALTDLHAGLSVGTGETVPVPIIDQRLLTQLQIGNWNTDAGRVDVLHHIPSADGHEVGYGQLVGHAMSVTDEGRTFLVASLADITTSKRAAGREKDHEALAELNQLLDENRRR